MKRSVQLVFSTNVVFLGLSVITSLLGAWALGAEGRGELAVITMWLFVFSLLGTLGLPYAHRYWTAKEPAWHSQIFTNTLVFSATASLLVLAAGWFAIPYILAEQDAELIRLTRLFLLNIPVIVFTELLRGQLEGGKLFGWLGAARVTFIALQAFGYLALYFTGLLDLINALWIIVAAQIVCAAIMLAGVLYVLQPKISFNKSVLWKELHYGIRGYLGMITEFAVWRLDQILLTALSGSFVIGLYAVAVAIAEISATLASSVSDALMPEVAASKDPAKASLLLAKSLRLTIYAQLIALIPLWLLTPYVLQYVFGNEFVGATTVLRLLLIASIFWSIGVIFISGLNGFGKPEFTTAARLGSAATTVVTLLILLPVYGITGAAVSSILGYFVMSVIAGYFFLRHSKLGFWVFMKPRRDDLSFERIFAATGFAAPMLNRLGFKPRTAD